MGMISIDEALVVLAFEHEGIDATNVTTCIRNAQAAIVEYFGATTPEAVQAHLSSMRTLEEIDSIIILASDNGNFDLFFDGPQD